jgi:ribosomal-protein-alanine N-acetyltransferase
MDTTNIDDVILRPMVEDDLDDVYEIEIKTFSDPWARSAFLSGLGEDWSVNFVAVTQGQVVGYIIAIGVADELHIHNIAVSRSFRGRGIGKRLLAEVEQWGRKAEKLCAFLEVRASNEAAKALYLSNGYEVIGRRRRYYSNPVEDAIVLMKILLSLFPEKV